MRQTTSLISCRFKKEMTRKVCSIFLELNKFKDVKMGQRQNGRRMLVETSFERADGVLEFLSSLSAGGILDATYYLKDGGWGTSLGPLREC